jgi:hypothetical protein
MLLVSVYEYALSEPCSSLAKKKFPDIRRTNV